MESGFDPAKRPDNAHMWNHDLIPLSVVDHICASCMRRTHFSWANSSSAVLFFGFGAMPLNRSGLKWLLCQRLVTSDPGGSRQKTSRWGLFWEWFLGRQQPRTSDPEGSRQEPSRQLVESLGPGTSAPGGSRQQPSPRQVARQQPGTSAPGGSRQ